MKDMLVVGSWTAGKTFALSGILLSAPDSLTRYIRNVAVLVDGKLVQLYGGVVVTKNKGRLRFPTPFIVSEGSQIEVWSECEALKCEVVQVASLEEPSEGGA